MTCEIRQSDVSMTMRALLLLAMHAALMIPEGVLGLEQTKHITVRTLDHVKATVLLDDVAGDVKLRGTRLWALHIRAVKLRHLH